MRGAVRPLCDENAAVPVTHGDWVGQSERYDEGRGGDAAQKRAGYESEKSETSHTSLRSGSHQVPTPPVCSLRLKQTGDLQPRRGTCAGVGNPAHSDVRHAPVDAVFEVISTEE